MCANTKYVYNRYIRRSLVVDCGRCPSCQQKKAAHRANRIRNNIKDGEICLFVTLTYSNEFLPYALISDIDKRPDVLPLYRDASCRKKRCSSDYSQSFSVDYRTVQLTELNMVNKWPSGSYKLVPVTHYSDRVSIIYYKDVQDFYKRLRVNLSRHFGFKERFTSFTCAEYGGVTQRAHFHSLIFIPAQAEDIFRRAIIESWPYADKDRTSKFIEIAKDCASYVSSYVNGGSDLCAFLQLPHTRQKHSYSKGFGMALRSFSLPSVLSKVKSNTLVYGSKRTVCGATEYADFPIPKYVINRYFPIFKGFSRLAPSEIRNVVFCPNRLYEYVERLDYSYDDIKRISVRLNNAFSFYNSVTNKNRFDYALDFVSVWTCYSSTVLKRSYDCVSSNADWLGFYDNISDFNFDVISAPTLDCLGFDRSAFIANPNETYFRVSEELRLVPLYYKLCKQKKVNNYILSNIDSNF